MTRDQLWPHQIGASEMVEHFLGVRAGEEGSSALVRMPTGTGKSGVIAVAAQELVPIWGRTALDAVGCARPAVGRGRRV